mmetsp:Transcript_36510/g.97232  ORF Transcript_36510/g.97232 Transcript_36510/m.97232 type:complete len:241 (+) Transcript_36510:2165-2887(+)
MWVVDVHRQHLHHLVHLGRFLDVLHCLPDRRQSGVLCLPLISNSKLAYQLKQRLRQHIHPYSFHDAIKCLLPSVIQLIHVFLALFVRHKRTPRLDVLIFIVHLKHHLQTHLQGQDGQLDQILRQPLRPLVSEGGKPLQRKTPYARGRLVILGQIGEEEGWLHGLSKLDLEEVRLCDSDFRQSLDCLFEQLLFVRLHHVLQYLCKNSTRRQKRNPSLLVTFTYDGAHKQQGCTSNPQVGMK